MAKFEKIDVVSDIFTGQSDIILGGFNADGEFEGVDYSSEEATIDLLFGNGKSLGQVVEDSTSWDGDDPETSPINDEQGNVITATVTAGTLAWSADLASTSSEILKLFMNAEDLANFSNSTVFGAGAKAIGFGHTLPVMTAPIMIINDEASKALVFPKAKIVGNFSYEDKLWRVHISVTAETIDTENLKTALLISGISGIG